MPNKRPKAHDNLHDNTKLAQARPKTIIGLLWHYFHVMIGLKVKTQ
jgi:hypothetical protein